VNDITLSQKIAGRLHSLGYVSGHDFSGLLHHIQDEINLHDEKHPMVSRQAYDSLHGEATRFFEENVELKKELGVLESHVRDLDAELQERLRKTCAALKQRNDALEKVTELEQKLSVQRQISVTLNDQCIDYCRHAASLETQLAATKKAYRSMVDANRTASERLAESEKARERMRESLESFDKAAKESSSIIGFAGKAMSLISKARAALAADPSAPATVAHEAGAQGVDVEKVMALVLDYGHAIEQANSGFYGAMASEVVSEKFAQIRSLLTPALAAEKGEKE